MNLVIAAAVFPVIFIAELPDKTMLASLILATRGRAGAVWLGAAAAFATHVIIATTVGVLAFRLLPGRVVDAAVAAMFGVGAILAWAETRRHPPPGQDPAEPPRPPNGQRRTLATAFGVIFAAEWGDLTQILTVNLTAHYRSPLSVGVGALLALWAVAAIATAGGQRLSRAVNAVAIRVGTAVLLTGLAAYTGWLALA